MGTVVLKEKVNIVETRMNRILIYDFARRLHG
jgi:hypothetical protein